MKSIFMSIILISQLFSINILILNSYAPTIEWTSKQTHTLVQILQKNVPNLNLYVEYMNTKKFKPTPLFYEDYLNYLEHKYTVHPFDIIITTDDNALNFLRKYHLNYLFIHAKIFFEGVNNLSLKNKLDKNKYAGVFEAKNPLSNLEIAKKVEPNLDTIYIISDASISGNKTIKQYKKAFANIKNIHFIYINNQNLNQILKIIKHHKKNSVMMLLTFGSMKYNNIVIDVNKVPQIISKEYNRPILVHNNTYINIPNTNIIGGDCTDATQQATLNANKVLAYLNGTPMKQLGFDLKNTNTIYINVKNLEKFGVTPDELGMKNIVLVNKPTSFYEIYKTQIISFFIILIIIIIFLLILAKKNRDLYKYSKEIEELNKNLEIKINKAIQENRKQEQLLFQQSKLAAMGEMIGAIAHQWRQPLNSLALNVQLLLDDYIDNKVDEAYLEEFEKKQLETITFMSKTIDDFRNFFSKDKEKSVVIIKEAILEVIQLVEKQLLTNYIFINIESDDSKFWGYKNEFKQVILNLINNSKDAILDNHIKEGKINITIKNNIVTIQDNGGGIPKKIHDRIFEPYFTTKDQGKGTGIGLYMSKIIIEEHLNGKIYFENIEDGTKFIIDLKDANENK